jgi:DNA-binding beta-propeller fold protein YncE
MKIQTKECPYPVSSGFAGIIEAEIAKANLAGGVGAILSFRSPEYTPETGGFHPVEVAIDRAGRIIYVTDFAFVGQAPFHDLAKEIDFDFSLGLFQHFGVEHPLIEGKGLFALWQSNFVSYHHDNIYTVHVEPARW